MVEYQHAKGIQVLADGNLLKKIIEANAEQTLLCVTEVPLDRVRPTESNKKRKRSDDSHSGAKIMLVMSLK